MIVAHTHTHQREIQSPVPIFTKSEYADPSSLHLATPSVSSVSANHENTCPILRKSSRIRRKPVPRQATPRSHLETVLNSGGMTSMALGYGKMAPPSSTPSRVKDSKEKGKACTQDEKTILVRGWAGPQRARIPQVNKRKRGIPVKTLPVVVPPEEEDNGHEEMNLPSGSTISVTMNSARPKKRGKGRVSTIRNFSGRWLPETNQATQGEDDDNEVWEGRVVEGRDQQDYPVASQTVTNPSEVPVAGDDEAKVPSEKEPSPGSPRDMNKRNKRRAESPPVETRKSKRLQIQKCAKNPVPGPSGMTKSHQSSTPHTTSPTAPPVNPIDFLCLVHGVLKNPPTGPFYFVPNNETSTISDETSTTTKEPTNLTAGSPATTDAYTELDSILALNLSRKFGTSRPLHSTIRIEEDLNGIQAPVKAGAYRNVRHRGLKRPVEKVNVGEEEEEERDRKQKQKEAGKVDKSRKRSRKVHFDVKAVEMEVDRPEPVVLVAEKEVVGVEAVMDDVMEVDVCSGGQEKAGEGMQLDQGLVVTATSSVNLGCEKEQKEDRREEKGKKKAVPTNPVRVDQGGQDGRMLRLWGNLLGRLRR